MDFTYSKFKENTPEKTVERIKAILERLDIKTNEEWVDSGVEGCYSVRVSLEDTGKGTNGKGTNRAYCLASGYAELMERLQPDLFYIGANSPEVEEYEGITQFPDETRVTAAELAKMDTSFLRFLFKKSCCVFDEMKESLMRMFIEAVCKKETAALVPFVNVKSGEIEQIPYEIAACYYGSNGMCAGNTPEEALVQGLAEIFERYVVERIIKNNMVPPDVPEEYLKGYPALYALIERIESGGRYRVVVKDCSMGGLYPCVACVITDTENGTFGFKMGAHPSFAVALERTFTEAMQGKTLEYFTSLNRVADRNIVENRDNLLNIDKVGSGFLHPEFFTQTPSYPFTEFKDVHSLSNRELLSGMLDILLKQGLDVLIRDVSYLGFPSFVIIVPGFSEIYEPDNIYARAIATNQKLQKDLSFQTKEARERLIRFIKFKRYSILENELSWILQRPFTKPVTGVLYDTEFLLLAALFDNGYIDEAAEQANNLAKTASRDEKTFLTCTAYYLYYLKARDAESAKCLIGELYKEDVADKVIGIFGKIGGAIKAVLPELPCWDCANCGVPCEYPQIAEIKKKLKKARKESGLTQDRLQGIIKEIIC